MSARDTAPTDHQALRRWARVAVALLFSAGVFATGLTAIADGDIFWHLAAGRQMVATHAFLRSDPFSSGAFGRPWIDVHWLFQLGVYAIERIGGLRGLVIAKSALIVAGTLVLARVVDRSSVAPAATTSSVGDPDARLPLRSLFAAAMLAALFAARHLLLVRPVILTLVFLAVAFSVLERHRRDGDPRGLCWLPILQVVWVNCQGLSVLGLALVGAYLIGALASGAYGGRRFYPFAPEGRGTWPALAVATGLCVVASFASPYGVRAALLPIELLLRITPAGANVFAREVAENIPPFVLARTAPAEIAHLPWFLLALAVTFVVARSRLRLSHLLVVLGLLTLALMANRNVLLLYWLATPIAVINLAGSTIAWDVQLWRLRWLPPTLALLILGGLAVAAARHEPPLSAPTPFHFPLEAARRLAARATGGNVFAPDHQGGYLIWTLAPRFRPYLDTRLILRTADEFAEVLALLDHPDRFDAFQQRRHFDYVVLPTSYPDRYLGLLQRLARSPGWTLLFTDGSETLFGFHVADDPLDLDDRATTDRLLADLQTRYAASPPLHEAARLHLAKLDLLLGHLAESKTILATMDGPVARGLLGRARLVEGDLDGAETDAQALLRDDPKDVASMNLLARVALARGAPTESLTWLRRALQLDPFDGESRALLTGLEDAAAPNDLAPPAAP